MLPKLETVDNVLPKNVTARADGGQGIEIHVGNPNGKGGVLLSECLSGIDHGIEEMANVAAHGKLDDAEHESQERDEQQEGHGGLCVHDVTHGGTGNDGERDGPKVERKVANADNAAVQTVHVMLDEVGQKHGKHQNEAYLVENEEKGRKERHVYVGVDKREDDRHKCRGDEIGDERVGGHRLEVAAQLDRHYGSCSRSWSDDATKHGLHEYEPKSLGVKGQDEADNNGDEKHLRQSYP